MEAGGWGVSVCAWRLSQWTIGSLRTVNSLTPEVGDRVSRLTPWGALAAKAWWTDSDCCVRLVACGWAVRRACGSEGGRAGGGSGGWVSGTEIERGLCPARALFGQGVVWVLGTRRWVPKRAGPGGLSLRLCYVMSPSQRGIERVWSAGC